MNAPKPPIWTTRPWHVITREVTLHRLLIMTIPRDPYAPAGETFTPSFAEPTAGTGARIAAALGAFIVLGAGAIISLGTILLAPLGMALGGAIWRHRGKTLPA